MLGKNNSWKSQLSSLDVSCDNNMEGNLSKDYKETQISEVPIPREREYKHMCTHI